MGTQQVVERILSDAQAEARVIVESAEEKAAKMLADASSRAETSNRQAEAEMKEKRKSILEKKAAAARLDSAKILLAEKRNVIDKLYEKALEKLLALSKEDCLRLTERLLENYAETEDEIFFAENYPYVAEVTHLPVFTAKALRVSPQKLPLDGGMRLRGEKSDKDLSYGALLAVDREEYQSVLAKELFK